MKPLRLNLIKQKLIFEKLRVTLAKFEVFWLSATNCYEKLIESNYFVKFSLVINDLVDLGMN